MAEHNDANNDNPQLYNNKQHTKYQHLFLSEQLTHNQSNIGPQMPPSQINGTSQINYDNNYQTNPQNNNITSLNNETISRKRKIIQIVLVIILFLLELLFFIELFVLFPIKNVIFFINNFEIRKSIIYLIALLVLIFGILVEILASLIIYYTFKKKSSRTIYSFIISIFLCIIVGLRHILFFYLKKNYYELNIERDIIIVFTILDFSLNFGILLFNLKSKCFKCCD